jgi:hypothetical protein
MSSIRAEIFSNRLHEFKIAATVLIGREYLQVAHRRRDRYHNKVKVEVEVEPESTNSYQ